MSCPDVAPAPQLPLTAVQPGLSVLILSLLLGLQPITTDLYLPALPALTAGFGAPMTQAQLTLTALLLAFSLSQLIWGPLSDRFGRRPILLLGLSAYVLASLASTLATTMDLLLLWRTVQGAAMGAAVMGARIMSKGMTGVGVIACLSPPLGGLRCQETVPRENRGGAAPDHVGPDLGEHSAKPQLSRVFGAVSRVVWRPVHVSGLIVLRFYQRAGV